MPVSFRLLSVLTIVMLSMPVSASAEEPDDPYLWLEEVKGEKPLAWVKERSARGAAELTRSEEFTGLQSRILGILDSTEKIPAIVKHGEHYYNFWKDASHRRGLWRRAALAEYRKPQPNWETVIDLDALAAEEKENWIWHGAQVLRPANERCLVSLSRGGGDADVEREFDLKTKTFVKDGFTVPEAKSRVAWRSLDSLFVATDFGPGSLTTSGYPRIVKEWTRGTPLSEAKVVFEAQPTDMVVEAFRDLTPGFERDFIERRITFWTGKTFLRRDGKLIEIEKPDDAEMSTHREQLLLQLRSDWTVGGRTYPAGALIATDFEAFLRGGRTFEVVFQPTDRKSLAGHSWTRNHLILNELDNVRNRLSILTPAAGGWTRRALSGAGDFVVASASGVDDDESDDYFLTTSGFLSPPTLALGDASRDAAPEALKRNPEFFSTKGLVASQHEAISRDGTRIPYFQVCRENVAFDGSNPTLLYGYGGFEISELPSYRASVGAGWLEKGGVYVVANIRGGGEFGPKWHQAALKANRPRAYEDFAAVAEDLIQRKVTSPRHLGILGRSNGGLLVGNMLTRRPELFRAVVCGVPLLDMRRYHTLLAGASWMGEYGDPDAPDEWALIKTFSPYHNLELGKKYPRTLFTTSTLDDRVHPGHARKMAARMEALGCDILYYENTEGGHGGAANNSQLAFMDALAYAFLWKELR